MRCGYCLLCPCAEDDVCPESEGKYGIEYKDGTLGCKHPRNWIEKRDREYSEYLGDMGTDMGIEHNFPGEKLSQLIEICKHMIGLDYQKPYHRHGKAFYKPYRNFFCDRETGNRLLDRLPQDVVFVNKGEEHTYYHLTENGLKWSGRQLKITIKWSKGG